MWNLPSQKSNVCPKLLKKKERWSTTFHQRLRRRKSGTLWNVESFLIDFILLSKHFRRKVFHNEISSLLITFQLRWLYWMLKTSFTCLVHLCHYLTLTARSLSLIIMYCILQFFFSIAIYNRTQTASLMEECNTSYASFKNCLGSFVNYVCVCQNSTRRNPYLWTVLFVLFVFFLSLHNNLNKLIHIRRSLPFFRIV